MHSARLVPVCRPLFGSFGALMTIADAQPAAPRPAAGTEFVLPEATPPDGMRVSALRTGHIEATAAQAFAGGRCDDPRRFGLYALLGDIVWQMEGIEREVPKPWLSRLVADCVSTQLLTLIHRLAGLRRQWPALRMLPAHDERALSHLPFWPERAPAGARP